MEEVPHFHPHSGVRIRPIPGGGQKAKPLDRASGIAELTGSSSLSPGRAARGGSGRGAWRGQVIRENERNGGGCDAVIDNELARRRGKGRNVKRFSAEDVL